MKGDLFIMQNNLQVFNYNGAEVRTVIIDGDVWFVAKDVCDVLGLTNPTEAIKPLDNEEKNTLRISEGNRGNPLTNVISESGLYQLILRSNKPEAKAFSKWVRSEVLPSIRKHGVYMTPEAIEKTLFNPDFIINLATELKTERNKRIELEKQAEINAPKVLFADSVAASDSTCLVRELAKMIHQNGIDIGEKRLFAWLRNNDYLIKAHSQDFNMPTQKSRNLGLIVIKETVISSAGGKPILVRTPKITGKGQEYFINLFLKNKGEDGCQLSIF